MTSTLLNLPNDLLLLVISQIPNICTTPKQKAQTYIYLCFTCTRFFYLIKQHVTTTFIKELINGRNLLYFIASDHELNKQQGLYPYGDGIAIPRPAGADYPVWCYMLRMNELAQVLHKMENVESKGMVCFLSLVIGCRDVSIKNGNIWREYIELLRAMWRVMHMDEQYDVLWGACVHGNQYPKDTV